MTYRPALLLLFASTLSIAPSCASSARASTSEPGTDIGNCELAVALLIDTSGSMGADAEPGTTILDVLKGAATTVIGDLPSGAWNVSLVSFPDHIPPKWGMETVTDGNRQELIDQIDALEPSGGSPIQDGLKTAAISLMTDLTRPRFIVIFSDGGWFLTDELEAELDWVAQQTNSFIVTVGYGLEDDEIEAMKTLASVDEAGPAFVNATTADELHQFFIDRFGSLCSLLSVTANLSGAEVIGTEGFWSGVLSASYHKGEPQLLELAELGSWAEDGSVALPVSELTMGPDLPSYLDKIGGIAPSEAGEYELVVAFLDPTSLAPIASASKDILVVEVDLAIELTGNPALQWDAGTGRLTGSWRLHGEIGPGAPEGALAGVTYTIRKLNTQTGAWDYDSSWSGSPKASHGLEAGSFDWTENFQMTKSSGNASGTYEVTVTWGGLGVALTASSTIAIP